ncbi:MAG: RNA polymerase-associated protein LEO1 [Streblomastix strix]|uniref:RNA polymerase-associated protein LEO1 n=1 Tax=Streblomastix strix TaxID=222440 RepID=A0A5J4X333_9EUKA|nr:MAG: RNA polymerase-associated protein LEO1 [Streblomastix strix]
MEEERAEQLEIPHVPPLPNNTLHVMKTSNVLAVAPRPFSEENYRAEFEAEEKEPISRARKVLRWRYVTGPDNIIRRESNANFVVWNDGSTSLFIGNECFDLIVNKEDPQSNYIFVGAGNVMRAQGRVASTISAHPVNTDSQTHQSLSDALSLRFKNQDKVGSHVIQRDPIQEKLKLIEAGEKMEQVHKQIKRKTNKDNLNTNDMIKEYDDDGDQEEVGMERDMEDEGKLTDDENTDEMKVKKKGRRKTQRKRKTINAKKKKGRRRNRDVDDEDIDEDEPDEEPEEQEEEEDEDHESDIDFSGSSGSGD